MKATENTLKIITTLSGITDVDPEQKLRDDLGFDSLQMITLLMTLEDEFGIVLNESDLNPYDLVTVSNVIGLVAKYFGDGRDD